MLLPDKFNSMVVFGSAAHAATIMLVTTTYTVYCYSNIYSKNIILVLVYVCIPVMHRNIDPSTKGL